jgi:anthranilate phosphoribosyltransferase
VRAEAARLLGAEDVWVAHGHDGLDEASPCAPTTLWHAAGDGVTTQIVEPADFGIKALRSEDIALGMTAEDAAAQIESALNGENQAWSSALVPTAALALLAAGMAVNFADGGAMARAAIEDGRAAGRLQQLRQG